MNVTQIKIEAGGAETVRLKQVTDAQNTKTRKAGPGGAKLSFCPLLSSAAKSPRLNFLARHSNTLGLPASKARETRIPKIQHLQMKTEVTEEKLKGIEVESAVV